MVIEDYVSFEIAKLLKEKGFNESCYMSYHETNKGHEIEHDAGHTNQMFQEFYEKDGVMNYSAPSLQMAMKWLREAHNIHIYTIDTFIGFKYVIQDMFHHDEDIHPIDGICFSSNEEACEAAIKYCLEHLI